MKKNMHEMREMLIGGAVMAGISVAVVAIAAYQQAGKIQAKAKSGTMKAWNDRA